MTEIQPNRQDIAARLAAIVGSQLPDAVFQRLLAEVHAIMADRSGARILTREEYISSGYSGEI